MAQEDKIKRETDKTGLMLAKLLSKALDKNAEHTEEERAFIQQFNAELDIFLAMKNGEGVNYLVEEKNFSIKNLLNFGHLIYELAHRTDDEQKKEQLLKKALEIYEYIHENGNGTLYLDVETRIKELS